MSEKYLFVLVTCEHMLVSAECLGRLEIPDTRYLIPAHRYCIPEVLSQTLDHITRPA